MSIILLRTMTYESVIGFGYFPSLKVGDLFKIYKEREILRMYFELGRVTFIDSILDRMCITPEFRIKKPGRIDYKRGGKIIFEIWSAYMRGIYRDEDGNLKKESEKRSSENTIALNLQLKQQHNNFQHIDAMIFSKFQLKDRHQHK